MGLGIYPRHSIHVDAVGHRTGGADYCAKSLYFKNNSRLNWVITFKIHF